MWRGPRARAVGRSVCEEIEAAIERNRFGGNNVTRQDHCDTVKLCGVSWAEGKEKTAGRL